MSKISAIILSAGKGTRMKSDICKQYIHVAGYPVLYYTIKAFEESNVESIIIVSGEEDIEYVKNDIVKQYNFNKVHNIVRGGKERYDSVINGLNEIEKDNIVLIHDGARPLITSEDINNIIENMKEYRACVAAMPVKDTIKISDEQGYVKETPLRKYVWQIQTPQAFRVEDIKKAYELMRLYDDNTITDDSMVIEKYTNIKVKLVKTSYNNIKITTPEDLIFMENSIKH